MSDQNNASLLAGYRIVVTGASSGIGRQAAQVVAAAGCQHLLVHGCRNAAGVESVAALVAAHGVDVYTELCDFADQDASQAFVERAFARWSGIDAWLHFAGADVLTGDAGAWDFETKLRRLWEVDVLGTIRVGRLVGQQMVKQVAEHQPTSIIPSLVFVGWDQASEGMEGDAGQMFGPTKAAVEAFAMSLAQQLAPSVRVNIVAPGWIQTAWGNQADGYWHRRATGQSLMNSWGTPLDVAEAAKYLISPAARFITAQRLVVNGGWNRRFARDPG